MPTDDERREVAARLRAECKRSKEHPTATFDWAIYYAIDTEWYKHDFVSYNDTIDRLADLIEPGPERTCSVISGKAVVEFDNGEKCSGKALTCGHVAFIYVAQYCPFCGARVVGK